MLLTKRSIKKLIEAINLQDYLARYLDVKRSGNHAFTKCPFHQDSSPSLYIYTSNYHCFACKAHGNAIDYEMFRTGATFREAVEHLSELYHVPLEYDPKSFQALNKETSVHQDNEFDAIVLSKMHEYFKSNGLNYFESHYVDLKKFIFEKLSDTLEYHYSGSKKQFDAFVTLHNLDVFGDYSERIVFPLFKENGKLVGFIFSEKIKEKTTDISEEEYYSYFNEYISYPLNCKQYRIFNWNNARTIAVKENEVFIVSSLRDFLFLAYFGVQNVVLSLDKSFDSISLKSFIKRVSKITFILPLSKNGISYLWETFVLQINESEMYFHVNFFPEKCDECISFLNKLDLDSFKKWLSNSKVIYDEVTKRVLESESPSSKLYTFQKKIFPIINNINNKLRRDNVFDLLANRYFNSSKNIFFDFKMPNSFENKDIQMSLTSTSYEVQYKSILLRVINFYHLLLLSNRGKEARDYLKSRDINEFEIKRWKMGYSPITNDLSIKVEKNSDDSDALVKLGIIRERTLSHKFFDMFSGRIIIPIIGYDGLPVALSGRVFLDRDKAIGKNIPKYINSPESEIFCKSSVLFNLNAAVDSIIANGYVIVVEGYMDCISLEKHGIKNVVAVMGTSLTTQHMKLLHKLTKRIIICFDNDSAGRNAARRSFSVAFPYKNIELEYLKLTGAKDPDEYVRSFGVNSFLQLVSEQNSLLSIICDWIIEESKEHFELFYALLKKYVLPVIRLHPEEEKQDEALTLICGKFFKDMSINELRNEMKNLPKSNLEVNKDDTSHSSNNLQKLEPWPLQNILEVKLIMALAFSKFSELPVRLQNVAQGVCSGETFKESICASALNNKLSQVGFQVLIDLFSNMVVNPNVPIVAMSNLNFSSLQTKVLIGFIKEDVRVLMEYNREELLKENLPVHSSMLSFTDMWNLKNSGFLRFQLRNIKLSFEKNVLPIFVAEALLQLELEYIDSTLKEVSNFHFDNEVNEQFQCLIKEREKRLREFGSKEALI